MSTGKTIHLRKFKGGDMAKKKEVEKEVIQAGEDIQEVVIPHLKVIGGSVVVDESKDDPQGKKGK